VQRAAAGLAFHEVEVAGSAHRRPFRALKLLRGRLIAAMSAMGSSFSRRAAFSMTLGHAVTGIRLRACHFCTLSYGWPKSSAIAEMEGQIPNMSDTACMARLYSGLFVRASTDKYFGDRDSCRGDHFL